MDTLTVSETSFRMAGTVRTTSMNTENLLRVLRLAEPPRKLLTVDPVPSSLGINKEKKL